MWAPPAVTSCLGDSQAPQKENQSQQSSCEDSAAQWQSDQLLRRRNNHTTEVKDWRLNEPALESKVTIT